MLRQHEQHSWDESSVPFEICPVSSTQQSSIHQRKLLHIFSNLKNRIPFAGGESEDKS